MPFINELLNYKNDIFIETGTYQGDTIYEVVNNNKYKPSKIISLELSDVFYNNCKQKFKSYPNIHLYNANSKYDLYDIIKNINSQITFWLDSHWCGIPDVGCDTETLCPVLYELEQIKQHHIKTHTIMIDDIRLMDNQHFPVTLPEILNKIYEINPNYNIKYYDDCMSKNDVLVAYIDDNKKYCIHKYLTECKTNPQPPGFGDFLRGTIALYNYSKKYNFELLIDNSHPLFKYLNKNKHIVSNNTYETIEILSPILYEEIFCKLNDIFIKNQSFSIMTNSFYTKNDEGKLLNYGKITEDCKKFLKETLSPSIEIENKIKNIFNNVYKFNIEDGFKAIHLRIGDIFINNNDYDINEYEYWYSKILNLINNSNDNYILISNSYIIASKLKSNIEKLNYWENTKIHLGNLKNNINNSIFDTLVDFFILSKSKEIISTDSGFSRVVSEIYDIKYTVFN
jgi:hypothetical protein